MNHNDLTKLAEQLIGGRLTVAQFVEQISPAATGKSGDVTLDLDRLQRCGFPEVIFAEGKTTETLHETCQQLLKAEQSVLATRVSVEQADSLLAAFPSAQFNPLARTLRVPAPMSDGSIATAGRVSVVTAGTSDLPVAEEARETLEWMCVEVSVVHDVGVAGPHRLPAQIHKIAGADAVVVVAGMEGALPSVVGGYVACPVIAVPTSVGYGASLGGLAALLGMLNSCAANVAVVNIDAGFKGGYLAGLIAHGKHERRGDIP